MSAYDLSGAVNAALFVVALGGFVTQLRAIRARKHDGERAPGHATAVLSLNYFAVSFLGYFAFFTYGFSIEPFNPYLVWPRLLGCLLVLAVLAEIAIDRGDRASVAAAGLAAILLLAGLALLAGGAAVGGLAALGPRLLALVATALISQGILHQIVGVRRASHPGAVSWSLHLLTTLKDLSTVAFGLAMGLSLGWPLLLMGGPSAGLKLLLLRELWLSPSRAAR